MAQKCNKIIPHRKTEEDKVNGKYKDTEKIM